jgi:hypothetical protein
MARQAYDTEGADDTFLPYVYKPKVLTVGRKFDGVVDRVQGLADAGHLGDGVTFCRLSGG